MVNRYRVIWMGYLADRPDSVAGLLAWSIDENRRAYSEIWAYTAADARTQFEILTTAARTGSHHSAIQTFARVLAVEPWPEKQS